MSPAIIPKSLLYHKWLDFGTATVDWQIWEADYNETVLRRYNRGAYYQPDKDAETLVVLVESITLYMAFTLSYVGNVELQILIHSMISFAIQEDGKLIKNFVDAIDEIINNVSAVDVARFTLIIQEVKRRVGQLHSPVINEEFLCYPIGTIIGVDKQIDK